MANPKHPCKFSEGLKRQVVEMYDNGKPISEILEEYDFESSTFHRWARAIRESESTRAVDSGSPEEQGREQERGQEREQEQGLFELLLIA